MIWRAMSLVDVRAYCTIFLLIKLKRNFPFIDDRGCVTPHKSGTDPSPRVPRPGTHEGVFTVVSFVGYRAYKTAGILRVRVCEVNETKEWMGARGGTSAHRKNIEHRPTERSSDKSALRDFSISLLPAKWCLKFLLN